MLPMAFGEGQARRPRGAVGGASEAGWPALLSGPRQPQPPLARHSHLPCWQLALGQAVGSAGEMCSPSETSGTTRLSGPGRGRHLGPALPPVQTADQACPGWLSTPMLLQIRPWVLFPTSLRPSPNGLLKAWPAPAPRPGHRGNHRPEKQQVGEGQRSGTGHPQGGQEQERPNPGGGWVSGAGTHMATQLICVIYSPAPWPDPSSLGLWLKTPCLSPRETGPPDKRSQTRAFSTAAGVSLPEGHANSSRRATSWLPFTLHLQGHGGRSKGQGGVMRPQSQPGRKGSADAIREGAQGRVALDHAGGPRVSSGSDERRAGAQSRKAARASEAEGRRGCRDGGHVAAGPQS